MPPDAQPAAMATRRPVLAYFVLTFVLSWDCAFAAAAAHILRREPVPRSTGLLMFPVMILGPLLAGLGLTWTVNGKSGFQDLVRRMARWQVGARWYLPLLLPPAFILTVLYALSAFASPLFTPNFFLPGVAFGIPAGVLEEVGWTGYVFPKMIRPGDALRPAILLGVLWAIWHLPVIDFLGTATPHGSYLPAYFLAFTAAMTAMRVLISWIYVNTGSVLLAQLMHISSTGSLVIFSPARISALQEAAWYAVYAGLLWLAVGLVARTHGKTLARLSN